MEINPGSLEGMKKLLFVAIFSLFGCAEQHPDRDREYDSIRDTVSGWEWPLKSINVISKFGDRPGEFFSAELLKSIVFFADLQDQLLLTWAETTET